MDDSSDTRSTATRQYACGHVQMLESTAKLVKANALQKGDVLAAARFAGLQSAKAAANYLPLLDPVLTVDVSVEFDIGDTFVAVRVGVAGDDSVSTWMPALTGATVACLTIFDMCKSVDRTMVIGPVHREDLA
ncbi:MAG TPA: cyclic pyranopterin monophosphate synthase MoaC [Acidimicrobiales bacterium]